MNYWIITIALTIMTVITRGFPFIMANRMSERINRLGRLLPAYIMLLLVIYEINLKTIILPPYGLYVFSALAIVIAVHLWLRNTFLTLFIGTVSYILIKAYL